MITRFGLAPRDPRRSPQDFQQHWRTTHAGLVRTLPDVLRYWQNHALSGGTGRGLPWPGFDACSEMDFADLTALDRTFASTHFCTAVQADDPGFVDTSRGAHVLCERVHDVGGGDDADAVRLITFMRLAPLRTNAELGTSLRRPERGDGAFRREAFLALNGCAAGQRASPFDGVEALWFPHEGAAERHLAGGAAEADRMALAGLVQGTERILARVVRVV